MSVKRRLSSLPSRKKTMGSLASLLACGMLLPSGTAWAVAEEAVSSDVVVAAEPAGSTSAEVAAKDSDIVAFKDSPLKNCIAKALGKSSGAEITRDDLRSLNILECNSAGIADIAPLGYAENLNSLSLAGNRISDLDPLAGLHLSSLDLSRNLVSDISPLASLPSPDFLYLDNNQISDISPLAGLGSLLALSLASNQISDVSPLAELKWLDSLNLNANHISDVSPLSDLPAVYTLHVAGQQIDLPDAMSGNAAPLPEVRSVDGSAIAMSISSGVGQVQDNSVTWTMPEGGDASLHWDHRVAIGFVSAPFSGTINQKVQPEAAAEDGWAREGGQWFYYVNEAKHTGWLNLGGTWYYMNSGGVMQTGWVAVNGQWYFMASSGAMATGWVSVGGTWYFLNSSGAMQTGWILLGGSWYYLKPSGAMVTGSYAINGVTYWFNSSGAWLG